MFLPFSSSPASTTGPVTACIGAFSGFVYGYDTGIMSSAGTIICSEFQVSDRVAQGFVTSVAICGAMVGSMAGSFLVNSLERKKSAFFGSFCCLFGGLTSAFSTYLWMFMLFRFIVGFGVGLVAVICPLYVSEVSPTGSKSTFGSLFQLSITFGLLMSSVVGYIFLTVFSEEKSIAWRGMLASGCTVSALALMIVIYFGMIEPAAIRFRINNDARSQRGYIHLFYPFSRLLDTFTGIFLAATLQLTGINAIMYFGPQILKAAGFNSENALNVAIGGWNFLTAFVPILFVRKFGEKPMIVAGTALMAVSLIFVGLFLDTSIVDESNTSTRAVGVGIGLVLFLAGFEGGIGSLFWFLVNDIFDRQVAESGASFSNVLAWGFNLLVSTFFFEVSNVIGQGKIFYVFGGVALLCTIYLYRMLDRQKIEVDQSEEGNFPPDYNPASSTSTNEY